MFTSVAILVSKYQQTYETIMLDDKCACQKATVIQYYIRLTAFFPGQTG